MSVDLPAIPIQNSYWVIPERFRAGEYPGAILDEEARRKLRWLLAQRVSYFLDLTEAGEYGLNPYHQLLIEEAKHDHNMVIHKRMSIKDLTAPSVGGMVEILDAIDKALSERHNIYLHCFGGKGRTGTVVGCYLARHGLPGDQALEQIQVLRSNIKYDLGHSPETAGQRRMVLEWMKGQ